MEEKCKEKINERINGNKKERKLLNPKNDYKEYLDIKEMKK